jgi:hypothetical protein
VSIDSYMNIQLSGAEELIEGSDAVALGQVLIRLILPSLPIPRRIFVKDFFVCRRKETERVADANGQKTDAITSSGSKLRTKTMVAPTRRWMVDRGGTRRELLLFARRPEIPYGAIYLPSGLGGRRKFLSRVQKNV